MKHFLTASLEIKEMFSECIMGVQAYGETGLIASLGVILCCWLVSGTSFLVQKLKGLQELGWRSLLQRRCDARLVLLYKIKNGLVACNRDQLEDPIRRSRHTHDHTIHPITCKTKSHQLSFFPRTILQWNNIPPDLFVNCNSSAIFRSRISTLNH